jgi:hypothetical protein
MKKTLSILRVLILVPFFMACNEDPKPVYDMNYTQVLSHMHGNNTITKKADGSWHWIVTLPDGNIARIQESTRVDLCAVFGSGFC